MACKIFVGGLSSSTKDPALREHFDKYGAIKEAVVMKERGFGFVTFEEQQAAKDALADSNHVIDGANVSVKEATAPVSKGGGANGRSSGGDGSSDKIFVGGLPQDCSDDKVRDYFSVYGTIVDAVVMKDRETNRSRGFGFVQYDSTDAVDKVMAQYSDHKIAGKWVEVKRSIPRDKMNSAPPASRSGGGGSESPGGQPDYRYGPYGGYDMTPPPPGSYPYGQYPHPSYAAYGYPSYAAYGAYGACGAYGAYGAPPPNGYPGYPGYPPAAAYYGGYPYGGAPPTAPPPALTDGDSSKSSRESGRRRSRSRSRSRSRRSRR